MTFWRQKTDIFQKNLKSEKILKFLKTNLKIWKISKFWKTNLKIWKNLEICGENKIENRTFFPQNRNFNFLKDLSSIIFSTTSCPFCTFVFFSSRVPTTPPKTTNTYFLHIRNLHFRHIFTPSPSFIFTVPFVWYHDRKPWHNFVTNGQISWHMD